MVLPSQKKILDVLRIYRGEESRGEDRRAPHRRSRKEIFDVWTRIRKAKNRPSMGDDAFRNTLDGVKKKLAYDDLMDLIEAHGFRCFDLFLDFCFSTSVEEVKVVRKEDHAPRWIGKTCKVQQVHPDYVGDHRTKLEWLEIDPGGSTDFRGHTGHEFVLVIEGQVEAIFKDSCGKTASHELRAYDGIAFSSLTCHQFVNRGNSKAMLVTGRPSMSRPDDEPSVEWFFSSDSDCESGPAK